MAQEVTGGSKRVQTKNQEGTGWTEEDTMGLVALGLSVLGVSRGTTEAAWKAGKAIGSAIAGGTQAIGEALNTANEWGKANPGSGMSDDNSRDTVTASRDSWASGGAGSAGGGGIGSRDVDTVRDTQSRRNYVNNMSPEEFQAYQNWANSPEGAAVGGDYAEYAAFKARNAQPVDPRATPISTDTSLAEDSRSKQMSLADSLQAIANGGRSPAMDLFDAQIQQAQNQNVSNSADLREAGPGGQSAIAAQNAAGITMAGVQRGNLLQAAQQKQAQDLLVQLYGGVRAGDLQGANDASDLVLGNRSLDNAKDTNAAGLLYDTSASTNDINNSYGNAALGYGDEAQARADRTAKAAAEAIGTGLQIGSNVFNKPNKELP